MPDEQKSKENMMRKVATFISLLYYKRAVMCTFFIAVSLLSVGLCGCGTTAKVFKFNDGEKTPLYEVHLNKTGAITYRDGEVEIQCDSRVPSAWERFIQPILTGAKEQVQTSATVL